MAQTITDYSAFLTDAREAVEELAGLERREAELEAQEKRLERTLEAEKKAVADACGSRSTSSARRPRAAKMAARFTAVVVLPTPPL